ncbi:MAG: S1 family peptidase [Solirubrobacterales bacterium]
MKLSKITSGCVVAGALIATSASPAYAQLPDWGIAGPSASAGVQVSASSMYDRSMRLLMSKGLSPARAGEALAVQGEIGQTQLVRSLEAALGGAFAGVWFDPKTAKLHVGVSSPATRQKAEGIVAAAGTEASVVYSPVRSTRAKLLAVQHAWNRRLAPLFARRQAMSGIDAARSAVSIKLSSDVAPGERRALEHDASTADANVSIEIVPSSQLQITTRAKPATCPLPFKKAQAYCTKPITSGALITTEKAAKPKTYCTAGPMGTPAGKKGETYLLTAGHCTAGTINKAWYSSTPATKPEQVTEEIGPGAQSVNNETGDYGTIRIEPGFWTEAANSPVFAGTVNWGHKEETAFQIDGEEASVKGLTNCHEGASSGEQCGEVLNESVTFEGTNGLVEDRACGEGGDSGGPWINESLKPPALRVDGLESRGPIEKCNGEPCETCRSYYEPIGRALEGLGLELLTGSNETRVNRPFIKIKGKALASGETREVEGKSAKESIFSTETVKVRCTKQKIEKAFFSGATGEETFNFEGCTVEGNGAGCEVEGKAIKTEPLRAPLAFSNKEAKKGEGLLVSFSPVKGVTVAKSKFIGMLCKFKETSFEGTFAGEAWSGGKAVKSEEEPAEAETNEYNFPEKAIATAWIEEGEARKEVKESLKAFGAATTLMAKSELKLIGGGAWGVFTK